MDVMIDYLAMGGYWQFVWPAYGIAAAVLIALLAATLRSVRANEMALAELEKDRPRRRSERAASSATEGLNDA